MEQAKVGLKCVGVNHVKCPFFLVEFKESLFGEFCKFFESCPLGGILKSFSSLDNLKMPRRSKSKRSFGIFQMVEFKNSIKKKKTAFNNFKGTT